MPHNPWPLIHHLPKAHTGAESRPEVGIKLHSLERRLAYVVGGKWDPEGSLKQLGPEPLSSEEGAGPRQLTGPPLARRFQLWQWLESGSGSGTVGFAVMVFWVQGSGSGFESIAIAKLVFAWLLAVGRP